jgi:DNA adenine methylase
VSTFSHRDVYVEPFLGGGNILLKKSRAPIEIASDLDSDLIGFYMCLRDQTRELLHRLCQATLKLTPSATLKLTPSCTLVEGGIWTESFLVWST